MKLALATEALEQALILMSDGGFPITEKVSIAVDKKLPFMGYTAEKNGHPLIVISQWALSSDMLTGLLVHELSHVHRIQANHPSHNSSLHNKVIQKVFKGKKLFPYQENTIHNIINNIQDLYADDISFLVYIKKSHPKNLNEFFLGWIHNPIPNPLSQEDLWKNAELLLSTAFANANLKRHKVIDTGDKIKNATQTFLSKIDKKLNQKFDYFKNMMINLPENVTDIEFEKLLSDYIREFLKLTQSSV